MEEGDDPGDLDDVFVASRTQVINGHLVLWINPISMLDAPPMWFCMVPDDHDRPAMNLVAFDTDTVAAGTFIDHTEFVMLPVRSDQQVGALRWWIDNGEIDQLYIAPSRRRSHIGSQLLRAADQYHVSRGWPGLMHSNERRTVLGEAMIAGFPASRAARLGVLMAPMDRTDE